jgi:hypothetical protein
MNGEHNLNNPQSQQLNTANVMRCFSIEIGNIIVLKATKKHPVKTDIGIECVFYVNDKFPINEFQQMINKGVYTGRDASLEEKEYCFWCYEKTNKEGADLSGLTNWLEWKKLNNA